MLGCRQAVRQGTLTPSCASSNLATPTNQKHAEQSMFFVLQLWFWCKFATVFFATPTNYSILSKYFFMLGVFMSKISNYIKQQFSKDQLFYTIIFIVSVVFVTINRCFVGFGNILWIADIGTICGVLNIINTAKHNVFGLIFNAISSAFIAVAAIIQHVWLNATVTLFINIPFLIVGIIKWLKHEKDHQEEKNLKTMKPKTFILLTLLLLVVDVIFTIILYYLHGNLFYLDAFFTSLCLMGVVLSSNMYKEQFYYFIVANFIGVIMYSILSFQTLNNIPYVLLLTIDFIVAIKGIINWSRLEKIQKQQLEQKNIDTQNNEEIVEETKK